MGSKRKFILGLLFIFFLFLLFQIVFFIMHKSVNRSSVSLMNQYYRLKTTDPIQARYTLQVLLEKEPHNQLALRELAFWYLDQGDIRSALPQFEKAYENDPNDNVVALQLSKLYITLNQSDKAHDILVRIINSKSPKTTEALKLLSGISTTNHFAMISETTPPVQPGLNLSTWSEIKQQVPLTQKILNHLENNAHLVLQNVEGISIAENNPTAHLPVKNKIVTNVSTMSEHDKMLNEFYDLKKKNSPLAWDKIKEMAMLYPNDVVVWKEAAYYALLTLKNNKLAIYYFTHVYELTNDPKIALQLAYIYDGLKQSQIAYYYFDLATDTCDEKDRMTAELAKSNLRGVQTKFLPYPYYASLDYSPLYMSRFKLFIQPIIFNLGMILNDKYSWKVYLSYRRTSDDRSSTSNQISNIFEDDAAITAIGTRFTPILAVPQLILFAELGKSVDLVYRDRSRWRSDFRGGLAYYNEWGRPVQYTLNPTFMFQPNADIYTDAIYYNRYHDGIATLRFRPGVKVFRYGSASLDFYYRLFVVEDQARQFYNNILENGPGVAVRFSDRYNIVLRYEQIHGRYLPANSPSANPYSRNYFNGTTELDTYFEF